MHLFKHFPDHEAVRSDVADYYFEVERFDALVASALEELDRAGELDNTIVFVTGDNGMPFPRCKGNLYDLCFAKRPAEELYDLKKDPDQLVNVAADPAYAEAPAELSTRLTAKLRATADPREVGGGERFDRYPYYGGAPAYPGDEELDSYRRK